MSDLTFQDLRKASLAHLHQWAPDGDTRAPGAWMLPLPTFKDGGQALPLLPPQLVQTLANVSAAQLAPVLAEIVRQLDRLAATKEIDLAGAIMERMRVGASSELPSS